MFHAKTLKELNTPPIRGTDPADARNVLKKVLPLLSQFIDKRSMASYPQVAEPQPFGG